METKYEFRNIFKADFMNKLQKTIQAASKW